MNLDNVKLLARSKRFEMFDKGGNNYELYYRGENIGKVYPIGKSTSELRFEYDSLRVVELKNR